MRKLFYTKTTTGGSLALSPLVKKHAPLIQRKKIIYEKVPWITHKIKKLINNGNKRKRKAILKGLENVWMNFKTA